MPLVDVKQSQRFLECLSVGSGEVFAGIAVQELLGELEGAVGLGQPLLASWPVEILFRKPAHPSRLDVSKGALDPQPVLATVCPSVAARNHSCRGEHQPAVAHLGLELRGLVEPEFLTGAGRYGDASLTHRDNNLGHWF